MYRNAINYMERKKIRFPNDIKINFDELILKEISIKEYVDFYNKYHYLGSGGRRGLTLGVYNRGILIAACTIGSITRNEIAIRMGRDASEVRELARFCIHPDYHVKNLATWFMAKVIKRFKEEYPKVQILVSFADKTEGHVGTIYKAANWIYDGETAKGYHYINRNGDIIHKKTIYDLAVQAGVKESEYAVQNKLDKIKRDAKKRYLLNL